MVDDEQDGLLPIANVGRIMRQILPPRAKISKEAKQRMQECATEFVSFVTGEASDKCHKENRKTVNGDDICWALSALGFDNYAQATTTYLHKYREAERDKANSNSASASAAAAAANNTQNNANILPQEIIKEGDHHQQTQTHINPDLLEFQMLEKGDNSSLMNKQPYS